MFVRVLLLLPALYLGLAGCSSAPTLGGIAAPLAEPTVPPVGVVEARYAQLEPPLLDLAIVVFDQGIASAEAGERVFPTVRKAESLLIPVMLSQTLEASGAWGVVRVVHSSGVQMPMRIEGEILRSDGEVLELQLRVIAADGRQLFERVYRDEAQDSDYPMVANAEPFADIYRAISNDLLTVAESLGSDEREDLRRISLLRFATDLAPGGFGRFLESTAAPAARDAGSSAAATPATTPAAGAARRRYALVSYPADGDPMLARLERIRRQDELFIDSVDERYTQLYDQVAESYALWREYSFELQRYGESYRASAAERKRQARRGSYAAMQQVYATFRKVKIQEEDLREVVKGFAGESLETVLEVDDSVFRLSGSVDKRYDEWRQILGRIYGLEYGLE